MIKYRARVNKTASNLNITAYKVDEVLDSISCFVKDGMVSGSQFGLKIPGIGSFMMLNKYKKNYKFINDFDRLIISDKSIENYIKRREAIENGINV